MEARTLKECKGLERRECVALLKTQTVITEMKYIFINDLKYKLISKTVAIFVYWFCVFKRGNISVLSAHTLMSFVD